GRPVDWPAVAHPVTEHRRTESPARRVVVLTGPSGAGKSRLAARLSRRHGWPIVRLDDFYRDGDDANLPMLPIGIPDWDDARSWDHDAALHALLTLCSDGAARVPVYDISRSRAVGVTKVHAATEQVIIAEGIFAGQVVRDLRAKGVLAAAYCVRNNRWLTFWRRLVRDLREHRKPPHVLWRRGLALCRNEPCLVAQHEQLGAQPMRARAVERATSHLAALA
ncbi:ATP-binding protein, partial [Segeticoccus rhizosphaerae]|uniref:uridine kinase family protein n=1 Tax=Segeticoccus rhizosphaerae TaxID=1104777 RepID=UPI0030841B6E